MQITYIDWLGNHHSDKCADRYPPNWATTANYVIWKGQPSPASVLWGRRILDATTYIVWPGVHQ